MRGYYAQEIYFCEELSKKRHGFPGGTTDKCCDLQDMGTHTDLLNSLDFARKPEWDIPARTTTTTYLQKPELPSKMA